MTGPNGASRQAALRERLASGPPLLLDGATGTELERRGQPTGLPLWSTHALLGAPDVLARIHAEYARAGAEVITAATFRTQRRTLRRAGDGGEALAERDGELCAEAVALARRGADAAEHPVFVAGSAPPLEDCYRPDRVPDDDALANEHARHAENLRRAGADLILIETMSCIREAVAAARAAPPSGLPFVVCFVCWEGTNLLSGEPLARALSAVAPHGPLAMGVNCLPPRAVVPCLPVLAQAGPPFAVYANLGAPSDETGLTRSAACKPDELADHVRSWVDAGAAIVGGCCGTTPEHTRAMAHALLG